MIKLYSLQTDQHCEYVPDSNEKKGSNNSATEANKICDEALMLK